MPGAVKMAGLLSLLPLNFSELFAFPQLFDNIYYILPRTDRYLCCKEDKRDKSMSQERTYISENNISFITGEDKTPEEIIRFLNEGAVFRSFQHILTQFCPEEDLIQRLTDGLTEYTGEDRKSTLRKVQNWMKGRNLPKNRETLFQICFILMLDEYQSSQVLGRVSDTGIHYRNPGELAYAYALRTGKPYREAQRLRKEAERIYESQKERVVEETPLIYTRQIQDAFCHITTEEDFFEFITEHGRELGKNHETAYEKFMELLALLQKPENQVGKEEREYTLGEIIDTYIQMNVPAWQKTSKDNSAEKGKTAQAKDMTILQKLVKKYWPNESTLVKMRTRKEDVNRKTLLLLYLVTEEFDMDAQDGKGYYDEDIEEDADTLFEIRVEKMNLFLNTYGMNQLDPGNVFDFLVLYSMKTEGDEEARTRMENVLAALFQEE